MVKTVGLGVVTAGSNPAVTLAVFSICGYVTGNVGLRNGLPVKTVVRNPVVLCCLPVVL